MLHTIYEVVDASVNHSPSSSKTLRVKLTVAPDGSQKKKGILLNHTGKDVQSAIGKNTKNFKNPLKSHLCILLIEINIYLKENSYVGILNPTNLFKISDTKLSTLLSVSLKQIRVPSPDSLFPLGSSNNPYVL